MAVTLQINPRPQFRDYMQRHERWACLVAHRRAGKTWHVIVDLIRWAFENERVEPAPRYAYVAPTREQAKDIAWKYFHDFLESIPNIKFNESELKATLPNGASIRLYSGESYERMRGLYLDGVVIDEMADIDPKAWVEVIRPCLSDYSGWATFIGTPKGRNSFYNTHQQAHNSDEWYSLILKASDSGIIPEEELNDLRSGMSQDAFDQEFDCDFTIPATGAVYKTELAKAKSDNRITVMPITNRLPVVTSWDLGRRDLTVVWMAQKEGYMIKLIDCLMFRHMSIGDMVGAVVAWGEKEKVSFSGHLMPHDAGYEQYGGTYNTSVREMAQEAGLRNVIVVPRIPKLSLGLGYVREIFPNFVFNSSRLDRTYDFDGVKLSALTSLENYAYPEIGGKSSGVEPIHNIYSHPCDALRTLAEGEKRGLVPQSVLAIKVDDYREEAGRANVGDFNFWG